MSFERLPYDPCSYEEKLRRSVGPGMYKLGTPASDCTACDQDVPADPYLRWQNWGPGFCAPGSAVDVSSDLRGLPRKNTKCAADQYAPGKGVENKCAATGKRDPRKCLAPTEDTRLSNPPCTLRGTGWNRFEPLCWDPQEKALIPFEWNTSYRIVAKDNHKAIVDKPMDQSGVLPPMENDRFDPSKRFENWRPPAGCVAPTPADMLSPAYAQSCANVEKMTRMPSQ